LLKDKAIGATLWSAAEIFMRQGLQFCIGIALARMVAPDDFGTIALLYLFTGIATAFIDSGFSLALIQRQDVTHLDESTVFWINIAAGAIAALVLWASAPAIANIFSLPILIPLVGVMALNVFVTSFGAIHATLLTKQLRFAVQMKVSGIAMSISGIVAITMAWYGYGVWALAAQTLCASAITTLLLWVYNTWRPALKFSTESAGKLFQFGSYLLASALLEIIYTRFYSVLIGKLFGIREVGFYNRADVTKQLPVGMLTSIFSRVALPVFSSLAQDKSQLRLAAQSLLRVTMLINIPMMIGIAAVARPLVLTVFGKEWLPAVPLLQVLCLSVVLWPVHVINLYILLALGKSKLHFRLEVIKKVLGLAFMAAGAFYGAIGIAWSQALFSLIAFAINSYYTKRFIEYGLLEQARDFFPALCNSLVMAFFVVSASDALRLPSSVLLLVLIVIGVLTFLGLGFAFRSAAFNDAMKLLGRYRNPAGNYSPGKT
jgi:O-antigen/teichoic acid export membrane protein